MSPIQYLDPVAETGAHVIGLVDVTALSAGDRIVYAGEEYLVCEVLPMAVLGGWILIGQNSLGCRVACYYANAACVVDVIGGA